MQRCLSRRCLGKIEHRTGSNSMSTDPKRIMEVFVAAGAATGDDRDVGGTGDAADQIEIVALESTVSLDGIKQDLPGAPHLALTRIFNRAFPKVDAAAGVGSYVLSSLDVDGDSYRLRTEFMRRAFDEIRAIQRRCAEQDLIGPISEREAKVLFGPDAAAKSQWREEAGGDGAKQLKIRLLFIRRGAYVDYQKFINAAAGMDIYGRDD